MCNRTVRMPMAKTHMKLGEHILSMLQAADACPCEALVGNRVLQSAVLPQGAGVRHGIELPDWKPRCVCSGQLLAVSLARQAGKQGCQEAYMAAARRPDHKGCAGSDGISNIRCSHAGRCPTQHCKQHSIRPMISISQAIRPTLACDESVLHMCMRSPHNPKQEGHVGAAAAVR